MTPSLALQLYSLRAEAARDLGAVLADTARFGYAGVEFAGFFGHPARRVRGWLDAAGLRCAGAHTPLEDLLAENFERTVAYHLELGNRVLVIPWLEEKYRASAEAWRATADLFRRLAVRLRAFNLLLGYHHHDFEFRLQAGRRPWDWLCEHLAPEIFLQLDTGNARRAGADVVPYLLHYPLRTLSIHFKEWTEDPAGAVLGEGRLDWPSILNACRTVSRLAWYIVEFEQGPCAPLENAACSLANLWKLLGGVPGG